MKLVLEILFSIANFLTFGHLGRSRARIQAAALLARRKTALFKELQTVKGPRRWRRMIHRAVMWKIINGQPNLKRLPRRVRRRAMFNAAHHAFRQERGLPRIYSKSHDRRARRGYFDTGLIMPAAAAKN